jgi:Regulator of ribonuclease activity B
LRAGSAAERRERRARRIVERQLARSDATLAALREAGLGADAAVELEFSFAAPDRETAESLRTHLADSDYLNVEVRKHRGLFSGKFVVSGKRRPTTLSAEPLRQWVRSMVAEGMAHDCEFGGWRAELPGERAIAHTGGCHCGRVRFKVIAPAKIQVLECNCSICTKAGYLHLVVPADRFKLLSGSEVLLRLQHSHREAPVLLGLRHQVVLRAARGSRQPQRECSLSRRGDGRGDEHRAVRRSSLGKTKAVAGRHGHQHPWCLSSGPGGGADRQAGLARNAPLAHATRRIRPARKVAPVLSAPGATGLAQAAAFHAR